MAGKLSRLTHKIATQLT